MSKKIESRFDIEFHLAAKIGDVKRVSQLLDTGRIHVDCQDENGNTPLILAIRGHHYDTITKLLEEEADPNIRNHKGIGPLFLAAQFGLAKVVEELLNANADLESSYIQKGCTALFVACQEGHDDVISLLLKRGVSNVNECREEDGLTPFFIASQLGHISSVQLLLRHHPRIDPNQIIKDGSSPLFKACIRGYEDIVSELLKYNPNLGLLQNGESVLHGAALSGNLFILTELLSLKDMNPNLLNSSGLSALDYAIEANHKDAIILLKKYIKGPTRSRTLVSPLSSLGHINGARTRSRSSGSASAISKTHHVRFAPLLRSESSNSESILRQKHSKDEVKIVCCKLMDNLQKTQVQFIWRVPRNVSSMTCLSLLSEHGRKNENL